MNDLNLKRYRLGVDVGGTFTDLALIDSAGDIFYTKVSSTPHDQSIGVLEGIKKIFELYKIEPAQIDQVVHGTTVATNALLEGKGSKTALLTTEGFKDVLQIGRQARSELYSLSPQKLPALIPRNLISEISERVLYTGEILRPLKKEQVRQSLDKLSRDLVETIAVCFLHSYINPIHEEEVKELIEREYPQFDVCISSDISREFREYERMNATVINAYVFKIMDRYLSCLSVHLKDLQILPHMNIMQSNGGFMSEDTARTRSVSTLLSGPVAGVLASTFLGRLLGHDKIISVDMGGTSFDISLIEKGDPLMVAESIIGGFPLKLPVIDIHTIGAGGGSIAWIDAGGLLQVGPSSAGANPGPACYGQGGLEPTVTDANLVVGRINPDFFLGGEFKLNVETARKAIQTKIATPLGITVEQASEGILTIVNATMVRGIRVVSVEKGHDTRQFRLCAYGGAGPLHACALARQLKIPTIIIPVAPGNFSTFGLLTGNMKYDYVRTYVAHDKLIDFQSMSQIYREIETQAFLKMKQEGFLEKEIELFRTIDMRYYGQSYELNIPVNLGEIGSDSFEKAKERFHEAHQKAYGFAKPDEQVELVKLRVTCVGKTPSVRLHQSEPTGENPQKAFKGFRKVFFDGTWLETHVFARERLQTGNRIDAPSIIEEAGSTILIYPGYTGFVDSYGNIVITTYQSIGGKYVSH